MGVSNIGIIHGAQSYLLFSAISWCTNNSLSIAAIEFEAERLSINTIVDYLTQNTVK